MITLVIQHLYNTNSLKDLSIYQLGEAAAYCQDQLARGIVGRERNQIKAQLNCLVSESMSRHYREGK